jgi:hypothetical protein
VGAEAEVKFAISETAALTVTMQLAALPQLLPLQLVKEYPVPAAAVSVT